MRNQVTKERDLFHQDGNATVQLPKHMYGKTILTDPHATPGVKEKGLKKVIDKGWNK